MGASCCCCLTEPSVYVTPDEDTRRQQLVEAAERRLRENESRGIQDVDKVKRQQQRARQLEEQENNYNAQGGGLKWQVN